jgi:spore maturation protein CgeB
MTPAYDIVILGLSITSSWGNGHATTYRSLVRGLAACGRRVLFLECDVPWYAGNRDEPNPPGACTELYSTFNDLTARFEHHIENAGLVIVGSFVPDGIRVGEWVTTLARGVTAFYDIDTPVSLAKLADGACDYLSLALIRRFHMYLSFTGGPTLRYLETTLGSPMARALYCSVDTALYRPCLQRYRWDLGYLGTYSEDRQPVLDSLMLETARRSPEAKFVVAGPMYPKEISWPSNVMRQTHLSPREHVPFYGAQRFTLNVTRAAMKASGYSPSVRLFEAGACAVPIISDWWEGLDEIFDIGKDVLVSENADDTLRYIREYSDNQRRALGEAARRRILANHTPAQRALELETYLKEAHDNISSHTARRDRRRRQVHDGLEAGLAPESGGKASGGAALRKTGGAPREGSVHEPAGASG